jgi:hypothetical protein
MFSWLIIVYSTGFLASPTDAQSFKAPDHDARIVVDTSVLQSGFNHFYDVYYGHNIRLGEAPFWCGDPLFLVHVGTTPTLTMSGEYYSDGNYFVNFLARTEISAKIYESCSAIGDHPDVGGWIQITGDVGPLSGLTNIPLQGQFYSWPFPVLPPLIFNFPVNAPLPANFLQTIPIKIKPPSIGSPSIDFGTLSGNTWASIGLERDIPVLVRLGFFQAPDGEGFLALDAQFGTVQRFHDFSAASSAQADFASDLPLLTGQNFGVGIKDSFWGSAKPGSSSGFLGNLLPLRVTGEKDVRILFWKKKIKYEVVIDSASVKFVKNDGGDAISANVASHYAVVNGKKLIGNAALRSVTGAVLFDRLKMEQMPGSVPGDEALRFRVADFKLKLKLWNFIHLPIRLSSGQLEQQLKNGVIDIGTIPNETVSLPGDYSPPCVNTNWDKMKADYFRCNDPDQKIGWLSYERHLGSSWEAIGFGIDQTTISDPRIVNGEIEIGAKFDAAEVLFP